MQEKLRQSVPQVVTQMWRVTVLVFAAIRAALLPISPRDLPRLLDVYLEHLARPNQKCRPKQIELFLGELRPVPG